MRVDLAPASGWRKWPPPLTECVCIALSLAAPHAQAQECPIAITQPPQSLTVLGNCQATFSVAVVGASPVFFQWFRDEAPIANGTNSSFTLEFATPADDGFTFRVVVTNSSCAVTSSPAVLTISADVMPPRLLSATGGPLLDSVTLRFDGGICSPLYPPSANDPYNYSLSGGVDVIAAALQPDGATVVLTTSQQTPAVCYTLTVEGIIDLAGNFLDPTPSEVVFCAPVCEFAIFRQPQSLTVLENCQATFDVGVTGAAPVFLQWWRDDLPIAGATNSSYRLEFAHLADNGSVFRVVVKNSLCSVTSAPAVLNLSLDVVPPMLAVANGGPTLNTVAVFFVGSCGLVGGIDPVSGTDPYNYSLSGGLVVSNAVLAPGGTNVILTTSPQTPGAEYTLYVENVRDLSGNSVPMGSHITFRAWTPIRLSIQRAGTNCVISWEPPVGILEATDDLVGEWRRIPSAASPYSVSVLTGRRFYRVLAAP